MGKPNKRQEARLKRQTRIRKNVTGVSQRPRLCVFRSARHIYAQVIDDTTGQTLAAASSMEKDIREQRAGIGDKKAVAAHIGKLVAERTLVKGIKQIVFDRNGFLYHGRVKAVSDGAREGGLVF